MTGYIYLGHDVALFHDSMGRRKQFAVFLPLGHRPIEVRQNLRENGCIHILVLPFGGMSDTVASSDG